MGVARTSAALIASLLLSTSARAEPPARVSDVTPDLGIVFQSWFSEAFALRGNSVLVTPANAGLRRSDNRGDHWERAMKGYVDAAGVEPFAGGFCQSPSSPATLYSPSGLNLVLGRPIFRSDDFGRSWQREATLGDDVYPTDCAVDPARPDVVYVVASVAANALDLGIGLLFKSTDGGQSWTNPGTQGLSLEFPSFVRVSPFDSNTVYISNLTGGDGDGIYVSHDGGGSFVRMDASPLLPFRLVLHPGNPELLFVVDSFGGFFRSADAGKTFVQVGPVGELVNAAVLDPADPSAVYLAVTPTGVYRSADFGQTFSHLDGLTTAQMGPHGVTSIGVAPGGKKGATVYVTTDRGPYRSDDGGNKFKSIDDGYRGARVSDLAIDASGKLTVAAYYTVLALRAEKVGHPASGSYDSFGERITTTQPDPFGQWDGTALAVSPADADVAVVAAILDDGLFATQDGGATWNKASFLPPGPDPTSGPRSLLRFAPGSATRVYYVVPSSSFGVARSDDRGNTFLHGSFGRFLGLAIDPTNSDVIYLGSFNQHSGLFKSIDGGTTITSLGVTGDFWTLSIDPHTRAIYAGSHDGGVLRSNDEGATWSDASFGLPSGAEVLAVEADPGIPSRAYAWVRGAGLFSTADAGANWTLEDSGESLRRSAIEAGRAAMTVDRVKPGRVYLGNMGILQIDTL